MAGRWNNPLPAIKVAVGRDYLLRYINGTTMSDIARQTGHSLPTVSKYMAAASEELIEKGQKEAHLKLLPLAIHLMEMQLRQSIDRIQKGEQVDDKLADRLLKGLFILDHLPSTTPEMADAQEQITAFQITRPASKLPPIQIATNPVPIDESTNE